MAVVPYTFANQTGQIPLSELDANFANVKAFAETAGNVTGNTQANITALGTLTSLSVSGNIIASSVTGNISGNFSGNASGNFSGNISGNVSGNIVVSGSNTQVLFNDNGSANGSPGMTFNKTTGIFSVTANVIGGNLLTTGAISATSTVSSLSNIVGANILTSGSVSATGNVLGGNVLTSGLISVASNITGGNLSVVGNSTLNGLSTAVTAANGTGNTQIATTAFVQNTLMNSLPTGVIVMWAGSILNIPLGWVLCNGSNGTPDLRDRFIVGAGNIYAVANTGGSANAIVVSHTHTANSVVTDPGHVHNYTLTNFSSNSTGVGSNATTTVSGNTSSAITGITVSTTIDNTGSSGTNANLPPYYALAYIMKT